ncbi:MAG: 7-cyano-7-deazaguanine synthase QueC [Pseudomonadota bacterium]|nr:7-cyano-7-deazaguanine synthase QueC [Pseudomonadota bacterium]
MENSDKAIILISGGLDSTVTLAIAKDLGFDCYGLSFDYKQRHISELNAAKNVAYIIGVTEHKIINIDLTQIGGSALTDNKIAVPDSPSDGIPITYVPARNTLFLSYAIAWAEVLNACDIFIGVNIVDYSGYPDCRPEYIKAYEKLASLATKAGIEGVKFNIHTPLIKLNKAEIIKKGLSLNTDLSLTVSCYQADDEGQACGVCDSCRFRKDGFANANVSDPTIYQNN